MAASHLPNIRQRLALESMMHIVEQATLHKVELSRIAERCHRLYGRGAFFVAFLSERDAEERRASTVEAFLADGLQLPWIHLKLDVRQHLHDKWVDCPEGSIGDTVIYRKADALLLEFGEACESATLLQTLDIATTVCFAGQFVVNRKEGDVYTRCCSASMTQMATLSSESFMHGFGQRLVLQLKDQGSQALKADKLQNARSKYVEALRILGHDNARELRVQIEQNLCLCALKEGAWEECRERCLQLLKQDGGYSAKTCYRLGLALRELGQCATALRWAAKAVALCPQDYKIQQLVNEISTVLAKDDRLIANRAHDSNIILFAMLASHVDSEARLEDLRQCLQSISAQSVRPRILISWSSSNEELAVPVRALLKELPGLGTVCDGAVMFAVEQQNQLAQFEHYRALVKLVSCEFEFLRRISEDYGKSPWVVFSDDDDFWHPRRLEVYKDAIEDIDVDASCHAVVCKRYVTGKRDERNRRSGERPCSAKEVDSWLIHGKGMIVDGFEKEGDCVRAKGEEYWMYAVRFSCLVSFFEHATMGLVANQFCDVAFCMYARTLEGEMGKTVYLNTTDGFPWMYFYNFDDDESDTHVCRASQRPIPVSQDDHDLAHRISPVLLQHFPDIDARFVPQLFAGLRRHVMLFCASTYRVAYGSDEGFADNLISEISEAQPCRIGGNGQLASNLLLLSMGKPLQPVLESFGMHFDATPFEQKIESLAMTSLAWLRDHSNVEAVVGT